MKIMIIENIEVFQNKFEANMVSGTYLYINENSFIYNLDIHNIFDDIDLNELIKYTDFQIKDYI